MLSSQSWWLQKELGLVEPSSLTCVVPTIPFLLCSEYFSITTVLFYCMHHVYVLVYFSTVVVVCTVVVLFFTTVLLLLLVIYMVNVVYFTALLITFSLDDWVLGSVESVRFSCLVGTWESGRNKMVSEQGRPEK